MRRKRTKDGRRTERFRGAVLFGLLLAALAAAGCAAAGDAGEGAQLLNSSGNLNLKPAVDLIGHPEDYSVTLYDNRNGLPTSEANAVAQTDDGFLWIGSYAGLIRYDGDNFERMDSTGGLTSIRCLYRDSRDRLWIGTNDNGAAVMDGGEIRRWSRAEGMKSSHCRSITEDLNGTVYIATAGGIMTVDAGGNLSVPEGEAIAGADMRELRAGRDGTIYGATDQGDLMILREGKLQAYLPADKNPAQGVGAFLPDPEEEGKLYFEGLDLRFYRASFDGELTDPEEISIAPLRYVNRMEYIDGRIWICAGNGIGVLDRGGGFTLVESLPLKSGIVQVMTDYQGNLWFASTRQGVLRVTPNQFTDLFLAYGLPEDVVNSTCMADGKLFVGTDSGLIVLDENGAVSELPLTKAATVSGRDLGYTDLIGMLRGCRIRSVIADSRGQIWISTWRAHGLIRYARGEAAVFTRKDGLLSASIRAVFEGEDGRILVALTGGANVIEGDRVTASFGAEDGIENTETLTVTEGFGGEIVLGSNGGGIYVIDGNGTRKISVEDGLPSDVVLRIRRDEQREILWIVTSSAIAWMTRDGRVTTVEKFPYANNFDLCEDKQGNMWVLSSNGIYVCPVQELLGNGDIDPVYYGISGGLPGIATANSYSGLTPEGDLYIAASTGVIRVNIDRPFQNIHEIRIALPYVDADGERIYPDEEGGFSLSRNVRKLTVYPYVLNFTQLDPEVSCRLAGFDQEAVRVRRSSLAPLNYTNLPGGDYVFEIRVIDSFGGEDTVFSRPVSREPFLNVSAAGTLLIDTASVLFLVGMLVYTSLYRRRGRLDDGLFFVMILTDLILSAADAVTYVLDGSSAAFAREGMITGNLIFFTAFELFPYLYYLYVEYRQGTPREKLRKIKLWYAAPLAAMLAMLLASPKTGWIFSIDESNTYYSGPLNLLIYVPFGLCFLASLCCLIRGKRWHLVLLGMLLVVIRVAMGIWAREISSTSFTFALFLACAHIHAMNQPLMEETL